MKLKANPGKPLYIKVEEEKYARLPIRTRLIKPGDNMVKIVVRYTKPYVEAGDLVVFSEKATAVAQHRAYHVDSVEVSRLAKFLVRFVSKSEKGIGISSPQTFQLAIDECGVFRILLAAFCAAVTKPFGIKGVFYRIAGEKASTIDGAAEYIMPPYNKYVSKGPVHTDEICQSISKKLSPHIKVAIVDINDYGGRVLGRSDKSLDKDKICRIMIDNPLGQTRQQTPIGILRRIS